MFSPVFLNIVWQCKGWFVFLLMQYLIYSLIWFFLSASYSLYSKTPPLPFLKKMYLFFLSSMSGLNIQVVCFLPVIMTTPSTCGTSWREIVFQSCLVTRTASAGSGFHLTAPRSARPPGTTPYGWEEGAEGELGCFYRKCFGISRSKGELILGFYPENRAVVSCWVNK